MREVREKKKKTRFRAVHGVREKEEEKRKRKRTRDVRGCFVFILVCVFFF
jgi:hypothetical protein